MKILITGGAGYIGSHFLKELKNIGYDSKDILVVDNLSNGFKENIIFGELTVADILDKAEMQEIVADFKPDLIVHFAAFISVPESVEKPEKYYENNFVGSLNIINTAINNNVKKFIFSSTAAVYGVPEEALIKEDINLKPINPYGNSKKMVEELLKDVKIANPDFNYVTLRYFNVAGSDPELEIGNRQKKPHNLIPIIVNNLLKGKNEINIYGNDWSTEDGTCIRDYIHVTDLVRAHTAVIPLLEKGSYTCNVGYGKGSSVVEVVNAAEKATGITIKKSFVERRAGDPETLIANNSRLLRLTDWKPKYNDLILMVKTAWDWANKETKRIEK
jgi:UDP-glucose 4-epimerase